MDQLNSEYDVVVIGGGLAGLTGANQLAKWGRKVLLLERQPSLGGLAAWFRRRGGHIFDVSLHGFPFGMKKFCRKYWNQNIADSIIQLPRVRIDNPQFDVTSTFELSDFSRLLVERFKAGREKVDRFFRYLKGIDFYLKGLDLISNALQTTGQLLEEYFPGRPDIHRLLMEPMTYANGSSPDEPAVTYGVVFGNFLNQGIFTFQGGTDQLLQEMQKELVKNGVHLRNNVQVEKILLQKGKVNGIEIGGQTIRCRAVLSNANLLKTITDLTGPEYFSTGYLDQVRSMRLSNSSCQVYLGIREKEEIPDVGDVIFTSTYPHYDPEALRCSRDLTSESFSFYSPKIRPGHDRYEIVASTNARWEDWADLPKEEYRSEKQKLIQKTIANLEKYIPGITEKIDYQEAATPLTFARYAGHEKGASFGTKFEGLNVSQNLPKQVEGLFHAGSVGIIMSGWLGTVTYGEIVAHKLEGFLSSPSRGNQVSINEV
ncbi:MAG: FAD-dependent oxidoreductase [bacterium]|nr:FAD-dependent oxidoreductase [bacterium]